MDPINLLQRAIDQTSRIVAGVTPDQYGDATPCDDWTVQQLVNHTVTCVKMFGSSALGEPLDFAIFEADNIGTNPGAAYEGFADALRATISKPDALEHNWTMPFGEVPGPIGASFATLELTQHGWDVARATKQDVDFDNEVSEAALATARLAPAEQVRVPGVFGTEAGCPPDSPVHDQLAAFLGRKV